MRYSATTLPVSKTFDITEAQVCLNDLLLKINQVYEQSNQSPPLATSVIPGIVKVGANILLASDGTISVQSPVTYSANVVQATGIIMPLYVYPSNVFTNATYNAVIDAMKTYKRVPTMIILNPSNGAGDPSIGPDGNYRVAIDRLHGAGGKVIGYVHASYTARPLADVEEDVLIWYQMYPAIDGIFVDEMTYANDPAAILYFQNLNSYINHWDLSTRYAIPVVRLWGNTKKRMWRILLLVGRQVLIQHWSKKRKIGITAQ